MGECYGEGNSEGKGRGGGVKKKTGGVGAGLRDKETPTRGTESQSALVMTTAPCR